MHMIFKSGLNWFRNHGLNHGKMVNFFILNGFTSSYGAGTKFIRNTGLYRTFDVDPSS